MTGYEIIITDTYHPEIPPRRIQRTTLAEALKRAEQEATKDSVKQGRITVEVRAA